MHGDHDLRARFDALRRVDDAEAPDMELVLARRSRGHPRRAVLSAAVAVAAAIILLAVGLRGTPSSAPVTIGLSTGEPSLLSWRSPTASLLETPGRELLQTMPDLESSLLRSLP